MASMTHRPLGHSGLRVSRLCLGAMMFGGAAEEAAARRIIDHALETGVNFIDTANQYADGRSEELLGRGGLYRELYVAQAATVEHGVEDAAQV